ncbi:hypothetical protein WJX72_004579 [[Myrmecia] bisecta]|uniref:BZIP domain-containing protein n=1 Tax=[Myrmecia] bisecta TaxID=41462 RepID=A0AAW1QQ67_9CHLO
MPIIALGWAFGAGDGATSGQELPGLSNSPSALRFDFDPALLDVPAGWALGDDALTEMVGLTQGMPPKSEGWQPIDLDSLLGCDSPQTNCTHYNRSASLSPCTDSHTAGSAPGAQTREAQEVAPEGLPTASQKEVGSRVAPAAATGGASQQAQHAGAVPLASNPSRMAARLQADLLHTSPASSSTHSHSRLHELLPAHTTPLRTAKPRGRPEPHAKHDMLDYGDDLPSAEEKRVLRMLSNRESARRARARKEEKLQNLAHENMALKEENRKLRREISLLISQHQDVAADRNAFAKDMLDMKKKIRRLERGM